MFCNHCLLWYFHTFKRFRMTKFSTIILLVLSSLTLSNVRAQVPSLYPSVLIELFSSEGCSSCPEADAFLKELITIADSNNAPVFCLDYHVDIWNKSGWVDRFSDTSFSRRQREYMVKAKQPAMFTPMMFINGGGALPGAAKKEVAKFINQNMSTQPETNLMTRAGYVESAHKLIVTYEIVGQSDSCVLSLVLAYKEIQSEITGGENKGKTLVHHHTAKVWKEYAISPTQKGQVEIDLPKDVPLSNLMLISFVQHVPTWRVLATDQLQFR